MQPTHPISEAKTTALIAARSALLASYVAQARKYDPTASDEQIVKRAIALRRDRMARAARTSWTKRRARKAAAAQTHNDTETTA